MNLQEHSGFYDPKRLGDESCAYTCFDTGICYCTHKLATVIFVIEFSFLIPDVK